MTRKELRKIRSEYFEGYYKMVRFDKYTYRDLKNIMYIRRAGHADNDSYNDCIIMADTETSKGVQKGINENHVCAWTLSIRAYHLNIVTLYGSRPSQFVKALLKLKRYMSGDKTIIYFHNLSYDWVFLRKFLMQAFGTPKKLLATKPHFPIYIEFENGLIFKDSLILAQRRLEKWATDLKVEHQKAVGKWDYLKVRNQEYYKFSKSELEYIEHDTLAGVECLDKTMVTLKKHIYSMPYTATGIPREEARKRGSQNRAREDFKRIVNEDPEIQKILEYVYHGGFTHANRHYIDQLIEGPVDAFDFTSSYPYCLCAFKFPMSKFNKFHNCKVSEILDNSEKYAFMFRLLLVKPRLKNDNIPMPALQFSKRVKDINVQTDNGRVLSADYFEIWLNEIDLKVIVDQYDISRGSACVDVYYAEKEYLPRWFTDYVFDCFRDKTMLKEDKKHPELYDPVAYALAKGKVNSLYGMCVQKPCKEDLIEDYTTGSYPRDEDFEKEYSEKYEKYLNNRSSVLSYAWGVWCTSYAFYNLFQLGKCAGLWLYSDTDSCYGKYWDMDAILKYNEGCKEKLRANNYGPVVRNGKEYWLGVVDQETHLLFKTMGAKRYAVKDYVSPEQQAKLKAQGKGPDDGIRITVAGVPKKKGAKCLKGSLSNFEEGFIFPGSKTGKQTHTYFFAEDIHADEFGNEIGDSIDLSPCDYKLSCVDVYDWEKNLEDDVEVQVYEDE